MGGLPNYPIWMCFLPVWSTTRYETVDCPVTNPDHTQAKANQKGKASKQASKRANKEGRKQASKKI
eukprot:scaffold95499_cov14-Tisochrysis_lutea.AAC.1